MGLDGVESQVFNLHDECGGYYCFQCRAIVHKQHFVGISSLESTVLFMWVTERDSWLNGVVWWIWLSEVPVVRDKSWNDRCKRVVSNENKWKQSLNQAGMTDAVPTSAILQDGFIKFGQSFTAFRSTLCVLGTVLNTLYTFVTEYKLNNLKHWLLNLLALILNHVVLWLVCLAIIHRASGPWWCSYCHGMFCTVLVYLHACV